MVKISKKSKPQISDPIKDVKTPKVQATKKILMFICNWVDTPSKTPLEDPILFFGDKVKIMRVMCHFRVSRPIIIKAIEEGYQHVIIMGCAECKNKTASEIAQKRITETAALMSHTGINKEFLQYVIIPPNSDIIKKISDIIITLESN